MTWRMYPPRDLALHGVRVLGSATASRVAGRYGPGASTAAEYPPDFEARGRVSQHSLAGTPGRAVTEAGRAENERRLAAELGKVGGRDTVTAAHATFPPLNDHAGRRRDERVPHTPAFPNTSFRQLRDQLTGSRSAPAATLTGTQRRRARPRQDNAPGPTPLTGTPATPCGPSPAKTCPPPPEHHADQAPDQCFAPAGITRPEVTTTGCSPRYGRVGH